ncbi:MAG TPA: carbon-nitrogen hydrolase [Candidatus Eremiobacteraceae bacterium]|nr:carbon-nitrogen hydrolase [Candidatus Eremiobacteraceae bacterium]
MNAKVWVPQFDLALVQMTCSDDMQANLAKAERRVREAAARGARVICLQELFATRYFCQREDRRFFDLAEPVPGPITERFSRLAAELDVVVVVSVFERRAAGVYHNTAVVVDADGAIAGIYRKMHIPDDPLYHEKFYFSPGDLSFRAFDTKYARIGVLVCWDQWFPEAARLMALAGASLIVYPTAIGWHPSEKHTEGAAQLDAWETVQRGHAIANGVYVAAVNRVGREVIERDGLEFWGRSFVADPLGRIVARGGGHEEIVTATCAASVIEETRRYWPFLRDRRIDAYGDLSKRLRDDLR